jgi:CRP/FNR family transcriptional regulator
MGSLPSSPAITTAFEAGREVSYRKSEVIFSTEESEHVYLIKKGFVKAYKINQDGTRNLILISGPNEILPSYWGLPVYQPGLYHEAMEDTTVMVIPKEDLARLIDTNLEASRAAFKLSLISLEAYSDRIENLGLATARQRVIYRILFLAKKFGRNLEDGKVLLEIPISYQDIADALNMTRETANREFSKLVKEKLIERKGRQFVIQDMGAFQTLLEKQ